ncbi:NADH dehydrogenase subunit C [Anaerolinea thermolimosa]|uniref:NADH-quinone oxidoreductase subunit C n=1 Tax=Anaerolinea thermolimosa TaxID=229919 RepID=UPI000780381D|nr:NADH-quinone oxidoreductase subunit C [Anaerolinea thermolimosa]GAP06001.1 NADH dehydrogenase subunit C [Anaerolinea thermolimosa]
MDSEELIQTAMELLVPWALKVNRPEGNRLDVFVEPHHLKEAVKALVETQWGYFSALTGLDQPPAEDGATEGHIEALYHFCRGPVVLSIRTSVPYSNPVIESICDVIPSATLYERELMEMFGVVMPGTPSTDRLLLADDWPEGVYPLRKSFTGLGEQKLEETDGNAA